MHRKWLAALAITLVATLGLKYLSHADPPRLSLDEQERDLAALVAVNGYVLRRSEGRVPRFDVYQGKCRGNIAVVDRASNSLDFLRGLHADTFARRAEYHSGRRSDEVPPLHVIDHYASRSLAMFGVERAVTPYVLVGWDEGCANPLANASAFGIYYR